MFSLRSFDLKSLDFRDLQSLFKRHPGRIGVHIECGRAWIVRLSHTAENRFRVAAYGEVGFDLFEPTELQCSAFQSEVKRIGEGLRNVAVNIEHSSLRVRRMVLARMPEPDLLQAIRWNFREHVEVPLEKYVVGYVPLSGSAEGNKMQLVAYGIAEEAIFDYQDRIRGLGLRAVSLEPVASALLASFHVNGALNDDLYHVCILFADATANFIVMRRNEMLFSRPLPGMSHEALIKQVVRDIGNSEEAARLMLKAWIENPAKEEKDAPQEEGDAERKFKATVAHFFSNLVIEIERSIDAFCILYEVERVDRIHVCGRGAIYPRLVEHLGETLRIDTEVYNPFGNLAVGGVDLGEVAGREHYYSVAVGLAVP